ncbi:MAG: glycosyltransferase family 8 protein [Chitinophagales bacterium]|nr:glycosyltransferase family 8 protein [Saprospirales bacterium]MBP6660768.1 glycosyltransferase family 8 protein [Chitinophagales bacterium]
MIHIAITINKDFILPASVMLTSLLENNNKNKIHVHILTDTKSFHLNLLKRTISKYNNSYSFYYLDNEFIQKMEDFTLSAHADYANYFRIFISDIIDPSIKKILYLDVDIIVCADLLELYNTDLSDNAIAAVYDDNAEYKIKLGIPSNYGYFNSGVLLMNLNYFRKYQLVKTLTHYIKNNQEKLNCWDQDALNAVLYDKCIQLSPIWNVTYFIVSQHPDIKPNIAHFTGMHKAWHKHYCQHPYKQLYFDYLKKDTFLHILNNFFAPKSHR